MVRGKVKLQRIDDDGARLASFSKRRSGLLKKAGELAVLCDAEVAVLVFSPKGKLSSFSSISSVDVTFERYLKFSDEERKVKDNVLALEGKCAAFEGQEANRAMRVQKRSGGQDITQLKNLEEELERELKEIRFTRVISFFSILFVDNGAEYPKRALLKDAGAHLSRPVMGGQREGGDEDDEPGRDCAMPPGPSRTLQLFADV